MGAKIRKSINFGLFRLNISKSGIGISFGIKGARFSLGPKGPEIHAGRHGLYYRKNLNKSKNKIKI